MDELHTYFLALDDKERKAFAESIGSTTRYIGKVLRDKQNNLLFGPKLCTQIELTTNGKFTRKYLRPNDWEEIWPELKIPNAA